MTATALRFSRVGRGNAIAPKQICDGRHRFQMIRVHACRALAQMIQLHAIWDWTNEQFVGEAMCRQQFVVKAESTVRATPAVAGGADPNPTRRGALNLSPEAANVVWRSGRSIHAPDFTMTVAT
jgi:hypothetical protein